MPKAVKHSTTENPTPHAEAAPPGGFDHSLPGDALILGLAALYRRLQTAHEAFDAQTLSENSHVSRRASSHLSDVFHQQDSILDAIMVIKATTPQAAMIQSEIMRMIVEGADTEPSVHETAIREAAMWSIYGVLANACGGATEDAMLLMPRDLDPHRLDVDALVAEWAAYTPSTFKRAPTKGAGA